MIIKILGSGPSVGVPMMFNHWDNENIDRNNPKNYRMRSSFYLSDGDKELLVECGPDFREQIKKYNIPFCKDVFLSHAHQDHIGGIWECEDVKKRTGISMNVWCTKSVLESLRRRFYWIFGNIEYASDIELRTEYIDFNIVKPYTTQNDLFILDVIHGTIHGIGFRYKNFAFTPDLNILPDESKIRMKNLDLWILQCNNLHKSDYVFAFHTYLEKALEMIDELKPKKAILTHLNDEIDYNSVSKILPNNVALAFDGMEISIE